MKSSLKSRYHLLIALLFVAIVLQFFIVLYTISQADNLYTLASDIQSILIIFLFSIFIYIVIIYNYLPYKLHRSIKRVGELIEEISNGNYQIDIDSSLFDQDRDFQDLIISLQKMLEIIIRFDAAKADKIFEHHQRIGQLINLLPQLVMITTVNGDIVYINDKFRERFPNIVEMNNLNELIIKDVFYEKIFDLICESLRYGNNLYDEEVMSPTQNTKALIKGSIVRNRKGVSSGGIYTMDFFGEEKQD